MKVGQEIRLRREARGWSQAKLAGDAGMGISGISQIETGARNPSAVTLQKIADALDVEVAEFFPKGPASSLSESEQQRRYKAGMWINNFKELITLCENRLARDDLDVEGLNDLLITVSQAWFTYKWTVREYVWEWCLPVDLAELEAVEAKMSKMLKRLPRAHALKLAEVQDPGKVSDLEARRREAEERQVSPEQAETGT